MSDNPLTGIPYRATNDDHDFNASEWGYKEADGHAHVCNRNAAHHDTVMPHTQALPQRKPHRRPAQNADL